MANDRSNDRQREPESPREERAREEREGNRGREGFGDDGGTRIGRPTPAAGREDAGPSTRTTDEGLEGAIMDRDDRPARPPTGMGAEASEGLNGAGSERAAGDVSAAGAAAREDGEDGGARKQGSEPLEHRETTHDSNYGGKMGEPRREG